MLSRSSARPQAALASMLAVAGATQSSSAASASSMCGWAPGPKTLRAHRPAGEGLEGLRPDQPRGRAGHDHRDAGPGLHQLAHQGRGLVGGDPAGHADQTARGLS